MSFYLRRPDSNVVSTTFSKFESLFDQSEAEIETKASTNRSVFARISQTVKKIADDKEFVARLNMSNQLVKSNMFRAPCITHSPCSCAIHSGGYLIQRGLSLSAFGVVQCFRELT